MSDLPKGWFRGEQPPEPPQDSTAAGAAGHWPGQRAAWTAEPHPRWPPRPRTVIKIVAAGLAVLLAAGAGLFFYLDSKLTRVNVLVGTAAASAGQNWLITGSTGTLTAREEIRLHTGHDTDTLSDTIMLVHIPANGGTPVLVSIPRDSYVPIPGSGRNKINAATPSAEPGCSSRPCRTSPGCASTTTWASATPAWSASSTRSAA